MHRNALVSRILLSLILISATRAQSPQSNVPIPPLQWINLTPYLTGSAAPPPLRDASIGYDDTTRTLIIFGGESAQGIRQSSTYLLNMDSLAWSNPQSPPGLDVVPPPRSAAISGEDVAASYRTAHIVIGGVGSDGQALTDVWEFDYVNQFWSNVNISPGGPSARSDAVGGNDARSNVIQDPTLSWPNNTFYVVGGIDDSTVYPLSEVWQLNVTGFLSSNNPNDVYASWEQVHVSTPNIPSRVGAAGAVVSQGTTQIVAAVGGCSSTNKVTPNTTCAQSEAYIINTEEASVAGSMSCPAPRLRPVVVANFNAYDGGTDFDSQVFVVLGLFNSTLWSDQDGLSKGEVDVLNINTGDWARILPAGDPGSSSDGTPSFPSPREGAVGISWKQTLAGYPRDMASDSIIFGGVDAGGNYLSDLWILRAYDASLTQDNQKWSGYGSGQLAGGVNASGEGVTVQYMTQCASALIPAATQTNGPSPTTTPPPTSSTNAPGPTYDTSATHKILSPVALIVAMPAIVFSRLASPSVNSVRLTGNPSILVYLSITLGLAAYGLGIAGLATSFTSISSTQTSAITKRSASSSAILTTSHGRAGLALFAGLYGLVPLLYVLHVFFRRGPSSSIKEIKDRADTRPRLSSNETAEKEGLFSGRISSPIRRSMDRSPDPQTPDPRRRVRSWAGLVGRRSSESGVDTAVLSAPSHRSFEVTNRPTRTRRASGNSLAAFSDPRSSGSPRNLGDLTWFERRRSLNTVGEMDYALGNISHRGVEPSTPGTIPMDMTSTSGLMSATPPHALAWPEMPHAFESFLHILFHAFLLGLCILSMIALWYRAPRATFIVFLVITAIFYVGLIAMSWRGRPQTSILSVIIARLRGDTPLPSPIPSRPLSTVGSEVPFPTEHGRSPYQHHHPPFRTTMSAGLDEYPTSISHGHGTTDVEDDDDEDEDTRQRRIEEELSRRDVSIVTVPKRKLFLTNPEEARG
ncbi:uncharacterized protein FIBRA_01438 [Fibroporia radiculosa]|uniref:Uncharacterized protein n=1 Tax=Fibroporia radiculosa TaxID=599839 RepID=J4GK81_9APHY|nr:uncharacterized protein FIBRA_01438 [Fibroporia radiculosa]CCL99420.1 predicted protein [Fibroporia radiculosa]